MSSPKPLGVYLIAVLLSVSALGYLAVGFYYLTVLHNPSLYVFKFSSSGWVLMIGWSPEYIVRTIIFMIIDRSLAFQEAVWLLSVQVVFYTLLCVILIATVWGLLRMRNWARVVTLIYFALLFVFAFAAPFYSGYIGYSFFDLNLIRIFSLLVPSDYAWYLELFVLPVSLLLVIPVFVHLLGDVKYQFEETGRIPFQVSGVALISFYLVFSAVVSAAVGLYYTYLLNNPAVFILHHTLEYLSPFPFSYWFLFSYPGRAIQVMAGWAAFFITLTGLFAFQTVFYLLLCGVLITLALCLWRKRDWARVATILYVMLALIAALLHQYSRSPLFPYSFFNLNVWTALSSLAPLNLADYSTVALAVSLFLALAISIYLLGSVKYEFE
ncbi:MAG: hypothetical protein ACTSP1_06470 [Candidatus Freyarchaeota archaeon]